MTPAPHFSTRKHPAATDRLDEEENPLSSA